MTTHPELGTSQPTARCARQGAAAGALKKDIRSGSENQAGAVQTLSQVELPTKFTRGEVFAEGRITGGGENPSADASAVIDYAGSTMRRSKFVYGFVNTMLRLQAGTLALILFASSTFGQDPFALGVRETPHLKPAESQQQFKLPPGFEIQLVAAEPQIQKPLNMAFDAKGRLWVTDTVEYPYAAKPDAPARDSIKVIEFDYATGKADKITTFVDGLNIPIGLLPYKTGVIAYSIPNIYFFDDTDGDGKCDKRTVLYGPFDYSRDTHGMQNAFRRGFDGWIYACHGFNNDSHVKGADGHEVHMNSGNTYRFRPDGSRIEIVSHGQVNPFGMCFDDLFNIFTADCHSKPITQILRGGYYESFGKPHDGLGYVPPMMDHLHGSTAICGLVWVDGQMFPKEYQDNFLSGNVMTSRINRNKRIYHGSTIKCEEQPDFLSTGDPWFRPVDLQMGPDGALYIADFYNRIIGHYEVPLPHPGRDRTSGRIWRVVYTGQKAEGKGQKEGRVSPKDLTKASVEELIGELDHPVLTQRLIVADELVNRVGKECLPAAKTAWNTARRNRELHLQWVLSRLNALTPNDLTTTLVVPPDAEQIHALKCLATLLDAEQDFPFELRDLVIRALGKDDGFVSRAAAEALGSNTDENQAEIFVGVLLVALKGCPAKDELLRYEIRKAIRDQLSICPPGSFSSVDVAKQSELASITLAVQSPGSAAFLISYLESAKEPQEQQLRYLTHAARYAEGDGVTKLSKLVRERWTDDLNLQLKALLALQQGLAQRGQSSDSLVPWAEELGTKLLEQADSNVIAWENFPVPGAKDTENPWVFQQRPSADGNKESQFYSSLVKGEQKTGILRSQPFELPEKLSFWCAGHIGLPPKVLDFNYIRLRAAGSDDLLAESRPPRNDVAQKIEWDLAKHQGKQGYVEIIDADAGGAYAWLAVGRFSVEGLNPNETSHRQQLVAKLATELKLKKLQPQLAMLLTSGTLDAATRGAVGSALVALSPDARAAALVRIISEPGSEIAARQDLAKAIASLESEELDKALDAAILQIPSRVQTAVAEILAGDAKGAFALLQRVAAGKLTAEVLRSPNVKQRIAALKQPALQKQADELTANLPPANELLEKLVVERRKAFDSAEPNVERGAEVFTKNCAACHQIAGKGSVVGPQLDGIGQRGLDRILEDVLDPNRNVDVAFRATTLVLVDGRVVTGLVKGEEGEQLIVIDQLGKEQRIAKTDVDERTVTPLSLMPANVHEIVTPDDFQHLVAYLLQQKAKKSEP